MILCVLRLDISGTNIFAYPYPVSVDKKEIFTLAFILIKKKKKKNVLSFVLSFALSCRVYFCL